MLTYISNHIRIAWLRLVSQFQNSVQFKHILKIFSMQVQEIEDALFDVYSQNRNINSATGSGLDRIGRMVGAPPRGAKTDAEYRQRIRGQIALNASSGEYDNLYRAAKYVVQGFNFPLRPVFLDTNLTDAECEVIGNTTFTWQNIDAEARDLASSLSISGAAGVRFMVWSIPFPYQNMFRLDEPNGSIRGLDAGLLCSVYDK